MRTRSVLVLALAVLLVPPVNAQTLHTSIANPDSALLTILAGLEGTPLSLSDAVHQALGNATSVLTAQAVSRSAVGASRREAGAFDPEFFFSFNRLYQDQPTASFFSGASILTTAQNTGMGGVRVTLPIGTSIQASLTSLSLETNSAFANLNPQYTTLGSLSLRQPLLGGFSTTASKNATKADREADAAIARYDQEMLSIVTRVEQLYWDLYAAERDYAVQKLTRDRAEAFLRDTQTRAKTGLIGPNQVANARTFLAEQEILLLDREEQFDRLSDGLSSTIGRRPDPGRSRLITVDAPPEEFPAAGIDALVGEALEKNLELKAARADVEAHRVLARASVWESLPKLDVLASLGGNGLAGTQQDVIFSGDTLRTTRGGTMGDAITQVMQHRFPVWSVGIEFTMPILFRKGLGEEERLDAEVVIAEQRLIQLSRVLEEEVRSSYRELVNGKRRLLAAKEGVGAAQEQVRIGLIEFDNGRSTAFELVRLGADFAVAQQRYSQALVRSAKAAANLRQLTSGAYAVPEK